MVLDRTLKMGMVGGGPGAFIGEVHRKAARLDGGVELVGGAFDIDPKKSKQMAKELILDKALLRQLYRTDRERTEAARRRAHGFCLGLHSQQLALPDRQGPSGGGF